MYTKKPLQKSRILTVILLISFLSIALGTASPPAAQAAGDIQVEVNGKAVIFDVPPTLVQGRTLVPLRGIFEALGVTPEWDNTTQTVSAQHGSRTISLKIGEKSALVNGQRISLDVPGQILRGRTLVPGRFIAESLGAQVGWDAATNTVRITGGESTPVPGGAPLAVHFIDVGQGDAVLLLTPSGSSILIDAGPSTAGQKVVSYLKAAGVSSIDKLIATHPHEDHIGGMAAILSAFPVREVVDSGFPHTTQTYESFLDTVSEKGIRYRVPQKGDVISSETGFTLTALYSDPDAADANGASLVLQAVHGSQSFLFTGDAEKSSEDVLLNTPGVSLRSQVLKVGHHGSTTSTSPAFALAVRPSVSIVSVGAENRYGHPDNIILNRLTSLNSSVYRTDQNGDIVLKSNGSSVSVTTGKGSAPAPLPVPKPEPTPNPVPAGKVDINRAGFEELKQIIHISDVRAKELISLRPFKSVDELMAINGIGEARLADIKKQGIAYVGN